MTRTIAQATRLFSLAQMLLLMPCFCWYSGDAQELNLRQYTTIDGLTSNETYHLLQDDQQRLLITSDRGLVRFDGHTFSSVPFSDPSLNGITVFEIKKGQDQRIWISTYRKGLFFLDGDTLRPHPFNEQIQELIQPAYLADFSIEKNGKLWFVPAFSSKRNSQDFEFFSIDGEGILQTKWVPYRESEQEFTQFLYLPKPGVLLASRLGGLKSPSVMLIDSAFLLRTENGLGVIEPTPKKVEGLRRTCPYQLHENDIWTATKYHLYRFSKEGKLLWKHRFTEDVLSFFVHGKEVWVGTNSGAFFFSDYEKSTPINLLSNRSISQIYKDHEEGYWMATTSQGLFYLPRLSIQQLRSPHLKHQRIRSMDANSKQLMVATLQNWAYLFHIENGVLSWERSVKIIKSDPKEVAISNTNMYVSNHCYPLDTSLPPYKISSLPYNIQWDLEVWGDSLLIVALMNGVAVDRINSNSPKHPYWVSNSTKSSYFSTAVHRVGHTVYVGTENGLQAFVLNSDTLFNPFPQLPKLRITDLASIGDSTLVVATKTGGLYLLSLDGSQQQVHLGLKEGLSSLLCTRLLVENDSVIWLGTNFGLNRIVLGKSKTEIFSLYASDGLTSDNFIDLAWLDGYLVVCSEHGISYFKPEEIEYDQLRLKPHLQQVYANDSLFQPQKELELPAGNRYLRLEFNALTFRQNKAVTYAYRLLGLDSVWTQVKENYATFGRLPAGEYTFQLRCWSGSGIRNYGEVEYLLTIPPLWHERWWTRIAIMVLLALTIAALLYSYFRQREQQRQQRWDISMARLKALSLQINPHFLFNSLHTVKLLAQQKHGPNLERYVERLGQLTRTILENSRQLIVPLESELRTTETYLQLEQHRFGDKSFHYHIQIEAGFDPKKHFVAPLLLQPLVENALWHGLFPMTDGERWLKLNCYREGTGFVIRIQDNGVGWDSKKQAEDSGKKHSMGIENIQLRMGLYEQLGFGTAQIRLQNLQDAGVTNPGTDVILAFQPSTTQTD